MRPYFTRERFGRPQFLAGSLLLCFLAQAVWLIHAEMSTDREPDSAEAVRIGEGWKQWHGRGIAGAPFLDPGGVSPDPFRVNDGGYDAEQSPLLYLASAAPLLAWPRDLAADSAVYWRWLPRIPFLACGVFLGASLWYVARRLCGNTGGFIALIFYCFSPSLLQASAVWHTEPEITAAWGAFGAIFTAIAVAHTLYAPREVVLWNWRRIVLLGVSLGIAIASQFSMIILVPMALGFLLYVAPVRKAAGVVIWIAACCVGLILLFMFYFFHPHDFSESMRHAAFWGTSWRGFTMPAVYKQVGARIGRACPALALWLPCTLAVYIAWPRTRYFGNTAPLLVASIFIVFGIAHPHVAGAGFLLASIPFLFIFVSGVLADLLETQHRSLVMACIVGMMAAYILWSVSNLLRVPRG